MRLRAWWVVVLVAPFALVPSAAADDGDDDDDERACGPLPARLQEVPCAPLKDPCDELDDPQPACGRLWNPPKEVCLSVTRSPPGFSYDVDCWVRYALRKGRDVTGLDDWNIRVDPPVRQ